MAIRDTLYSCLNLAHRATFEGEAVAAFEAANRIAPKCGYRDAFEAAKYWDLDMSRFMPKAAANDVPTGIELNSRQRRILRSRFAGSLYVMRHRPGTRWDVSSMPADILTALGL